MRKSFLAITSAVLLVVLLASVVLASTYTAIVTVTSNATYSSLPLIVSGNNSFLASNGYIRVDGLGVQLQAGGTNLPTMVVDNQTLMVANLAVGANSFTYATGQTPVLNMPIITGYGGNVTVADNASLRLFDSWNISKTGYYDATQVGATWFNKPNVITSKITGAGNLTTNVTTNTTLYLYPTANSSVSGFLTVVGANSSWQAVSSNDNSTSYLAIVNNAAGFTANNTFTSNGSAYTLNGTVAFVRLYFTVSTNTTGVPPTFYFQGVMQNATNGNQFGATSGVWSTYNLTYFSDPSGGAWTISDIQNLNFGVYCAAPIDYELRIGYIYAEVNYGQIQTIKTTGITQGEHNLRLGTDSGNYTLFVDNVRNGSVTINGTGVSDIGGAITAVQSTLNPYINSANISINGTQVLFYAPNAIIVGTTLPDRSGFANTGTINYGLNVAGLTVSNLSSLSPTGQNPTMINLQVGQSPDVLPSYNHDPIGTQTPNNPFSVIMQAAATVLNSGVPGATPFTELNIWTFVAICAVIITFVGVAIFTRGHVGWSMMATSVVIGIFTIPGMQVFPSGLLWIAVLLMIAGIVFEARA